MTPNNGTMSRSGKVYDFVFVGTGLISILEAVHQSRRGKSVLMIERERDLGGSWLSKDLFGVHDVENAIHYFLPDRTAPEFMRDVLKWRVIPSPSKYRVFHVPGLGRCKARYDSKIARIASNVGEASGLAELYPAIRDALLRRPQQSYYVEGGAPEMLRKIRPLLAGANVEIRYSAFIDRIHIDTAAGRVESHVGAEKIISKTIVISHGAKLNQLTGSNGAFPLEHQVLPRPAAHMFLRDDAPSEMYECIFTADPTIKYAHDVTRFTREAAELAGKKKVIVLALQHDVQKSAGLYPKVLARLKWAGIAGQDAVLEGAQWWDIVLPSISDDDLDRMKATFGPQVEVLKTDNFGAGIGLHAEKWSTTIKFPHEKMKLRVA